MCARGREEALHSADNHTFLDDKAHYTLERGERAQIWPVHCAGVDDAQPRGSGQRLVTRRSQVKAARRGVEKEEER